MWKCVVFVWKYDDQHVLIVDFRLFSSLNTGWKWVARLRRLGGCDYKSIKHSIKSSVYISCLQIAFDVYLWRMFASFERKKRTTIYFQYYAAAQKKGFSLPMAKHTHRFRLFIHNPSGYHQKWYSKFRYSWILSIHNFFHQIRIPFLHQEFLG